MSNGDYDTMQIQIDDILTDIVKEQIPGDDVALLMGGGVDSATLLFTCLRLNKKPHGYSFFMEGKVTYDSTKAEEICKSFGVPFTPVPLPESNLAEDFKTLASKYGCKKKTHFECTFPFLYTFPKIEERYVLSGVGADSHYVLSKKGMMHFKHTVELMNKFRHNYFHCTPNAGGIEQFKQFCEEYDKELCVPYFEPEVYDYFYDRSWEEINKPVQKALIKQCYPEFDKCGKVKPHLNYQLNAEIDKSFEKLLDNREINFKNRVRVMDICRDWYTLNKSKANLEHLF